MKFWEVLQDAITYIVVTVIGGLFAGVTWLVRRVITHQKQIELLKQELAHREMLRLQDREDLTVIRAKMDATHDLLLRSLHPPKAGTRSIMESEDDESDT